MTEYDYSPEAYDRYLATQNRIANWVDKTEQHRAEYQSANNGPPDLTRSGPGQARAKPPPPRQYSGQSQPRQLVVHPPPPESDSSSSSDSYHEAPRPAQMHRPSAGMVLPQVQQQHLSSPPPMMMPPVFVTSPHRSSHHHRHRSHDHRRSRSHHSPVYYTVASPPPGYQYTYPSGTQGYAMMPQYQVPLTSSQPPRSAPASITSFTAPLAQPTSYFQPQPSSAFLPSNTYGVPSPAYPMNSTPAGSPLLSPPYPALPTYQSFAAQPPYIIPRAPQRVYDLRVG